jgi:hypothetical protein
MAKILLKKDQGEPILLPMDTTLGFTLVGDRTRFYSRLRLTLRLSLMANPVTGFLIRDGLEKNYPD